MMVTETKLLADIKADPSGRISAIFGTFGVVDAEGDVLAPGAIPSGLSVPISAYGHSSWTGALPVGRGTIREEGDRAVLRGRLFLDTIGGRETYATLAGLAELGQWSFGYVPLAWHPERIAGKLIRILDRVDIFEVSPVLVAAGVGTRTVALAERREALELAEMEHRIRRDLAGLGRRDRAAVDTYRVTGLVRRLGRGEAAALTLGGQLEALRARTLGVTVR